MTCSGSYSGCTLQVLLIVDFVCGGEIKIIIIIFAVPPNSSPVSANCKLLSFSYSFYPLCCGQNLRVPPHVRRGKRKYDDSKKCWSFSYIFSLYDVALKKTGPENIMQFLYLCTVYCTRYTARQMLDHGPFCTNLTFSLSFFLAVDCIKSCPSFIIAKTSSTSAS